MGPRFLYLMVAFPGADHLFHMGFCEVDTLGLPHALLVTTANVTDRAGALEMISLN